MNLQLMCNPNKKCASAEEDEIEILFIVQDYKIMNTAAKAAAKLKPF